MARRARIAFACVLLLGLALGADPARAELRIWFTADATLSSVDLDGADLRAHWGLPLPDGLEEMGDFEIDAPRREVLIGTGVDLGSFFSGNLASIFLRAGTEYFDIHYYPYEWPGVQFDPEGLPVAVALHREEGRVYWLAEEESRVSFEFWVRRSFLDGSGEETLHHEQSADGYGLALDRSEGRVYWIQTGDAPGPYRFAIVRAALDGSDRQVVFETDGAAELGPELGPLAFDEIGRRLYFVGAGEPLRIRSVDPDGGDARDEFTPDGYAVRGLALHPAGTHLYWTRWSSTGGAIERGALGTTTIEPVFSDVVPWGALRIAEAPPPASHAIVVADNGARKVVRLDLDTRASQAIASGDRLLGPRGVAVEAGGGLVVADLVAQELVRVDPATGVQSAASAPGLLQGPADVAVDADGSLVVADREAGALVRVAVDGASAAPLPFPASADGPLGVALAPGALFATDGASASLLQVDPLAPGFTPVAAGDPFVRPTRVAVAPSAEVAYVSDTGLDTLMSVDLATGDVTPLAPDGSFGDPFGVVVDPNGDLLVVDRLTRQLVRVDPRTGARRVLSESGAFADPRGIAILPVPEPGALGAWVAAATLACIASRARLRAAGRVVGDRATLRAWPILRATPSSPLCVGPARASHSCTDRARREPPVPTPISTWQPGGPERGPRPGRSPCRTTSTCWS